MKKLYVCGLLVLGLALAIGTVVKAGDSDAEPLSDAEKEDISSRTVAASDQIFTPEYIDQINAAQQAADEKSRQDRARHDKLLDWFLRH